jgi:hypothetical protein
VSVHDSSEYRDRVCEKQDRLPDCPMIRMVGNRIHDGA